MAAPVAVALTPLVLMLHEVRPAVKCPRVLLDFDEYAPDQLADGHDAAQPAAEVVLPVGQIQRGRDVDVVAGLWWWVADPETLRALV
jgi:hypothetical protein